MLQITQITIVDEEGGILQLEAKSKEDAQQLAELKAKGFAVSSIQEGKENYTSVTVKLQKHRG